MMREFKVANSRMLSTSFQAIFTTIISVPVLSWIPRAEGTGAYAKLSCPYTLFYFFVYSPGSHRPRRLVWVVGQEHHLLHRFRW